MFNLLCFESGSRTTPTTLMSLMQRDSVQPSAPVGDVRRFSGDGVQRSDDSDNCVADRAVSYLVIGGCREEALTTTAGGGGRRRLAADGREYNHLTGLNVVIYPGRRRNYR